MPGHADQLELFPTKLGLYSVKRCPGWSLFGLSWLLRSGQLSTQHAGLIVLGWESRRTCNSQPPVPAVADVLIPPTLTLFRHLSHRRRRTVSYSS